MPAFSTNERLNPREARNQVHSATVPTQSRSDFQREVKGIQCSLKLACRDSSEDFPALVAGDDPVIPSDATEQATATLRRAEVGVRNNGLDVLRQSSG